MLQRKDKLYPSDLEHALIDQCLFALEGYTQ
jgi:hypothetical protein